jgi:hypothetical protein
MMEAHMPGYVQNDNGALLVTFCHDDKDDVEVIAASGKEALEIARGLLAQCEELHHGDLLSIWRAPPAPAPDKKRRRLPSAPRTREVR